jgi:restriction system protein
VGRRLGLGGALRQEQMARAHAAQVRAHNAQRRQAEQARRTYERAQAADERERKRLYAEARAADANARNEQLNASVADLQNLLANTLMVDDYLDFDALKKTTMVPDFEGGELEVPKPIPRWDQFEVPPLSGPKKLFSSFKQKHAAEESRARQRYA